MSVRGKRREAGSKSNGTGEHQEETETTVASGQVPAETETKKSNDKAVELTADQILSLTQQWAKQVNAQQEAVTAAKADYDSEKGTLRELYKQVKAELGPEGVERVKELVKLRRDGKAAEDNIRARIETLTWLVQHANALPGQQLELLADLRPNDDRAYADGKRDGLAGDPFNPKYGQGTLAYQRFQEGYQAGQGILAKGFKPLEKPPTPVGDAEPTHEVQA